MLISDILAPDRTLCSAKAGSKKRLLEFLANFLAEKSPYANADILFEQLLARERLGSTGIGEGVAIPHCRLPGFDQTNGILLKLEHPIDFDSIDGQPVDLVFALVVPEEHNDEHLVTLSNIAELLQDPAQRAKLRSAQSDDELYRAATVNRAA